MSVWSSITISPLPTTNREPIHTTTTGSIGSLLKSASAVYSRELLQYPQQSVLQAALASLKQFVVHHHPLVVVAAALPYDIQIAEETACARVWKRLKMAMSF